jgi:hypothetical protein
MAGCPSHTGAVPGEIGRPGTPGHFAWSWANAGAEQSEPAYGDLDGDGVSEMLITIDCIGYFPATRGEGGVGVTVAALKLDRTGQPTVLGYLGTGEWRVVQRLAVHNGVATVTFTSRDNNRSVVDYRWTGVKFTRS